nr:hypothetical protein [Tanacetum cinerariifolium]
MRIEQYFLMTDYSLWEVIINEDSPAPTIVVDGVVQPVTYKSADQKLARRNELKAREKRFGGNTEIKKVQKTLLKQQFANFTGSSSENLDQIHDRLQKLVSQLEIHRVSLSQEDVNLKFLCSLPSEWKTHTLIWKNKADLEEHSNPTQNLDFVSSSNTDSTTDSISTATSVSAVCAKLPMSSHPNIDSLSNEVIFPFFASQSTSPQLDNKDLKQIDIDDLEEMDLRWQMAMLTMRARRFLQKTGRNLGNNRVTSMGFDMSKVECYNCHRKGRFARECRSPKDSRRSGATEPQRRSAPVENSTSNALVSQCDDSDCKSLSPSSLSDRIQPSGRYHAVPPPITLTFMPPKPDLVFHTAPISVETDHSAFTVQLSPSKPAQELSHITRPLSPIIEDWVSDSKDESEINDPQSVPSFVQSSKQVKTLRHSVQLVEAPILDATLKPTSPKFNSSSKRKNRKTCFVCRMLTQSKPVSITAVRPVSAAVPKIMMTRPRHAHSIYTKSKSPIRRHITSSPSPKTSNSPPRVTAAQASVVSAAKGNLNGGKISGKGKIKTGKLDFEDVYFVKELKFNLFSVSQMCDKKNKVLFTDTECLVLSPDFKLPDESQATIDESNLWHRRLGHINFKTINKLVKDNLVRGLPTKVFKNNNTCVAYKKGKQHRASCKTKPVSFVDQPLFRLHMDLFGPTFVKSLNKKSYYLVIIDDYNRFTWVFFLATKDETSPILKTFITGLENQLSLKVKQNGTAERKNRTLIEAAKTMLEDSLLPIPFWAEAVNTACYVQNRVLVTKPHNKTPYELLHGQIPSIGFMRPFGCPVTILNTLDPLGKFEGKNKDGDDAFDGKEHDVDTKKLESVVNVSPSKVEDYSDNSSNDEDATGFIVPAAGQNYSNNTNLFSAAGPSNTTASPAHGKSSFKDASQLPENPDMLEMEDITYSDHETIGVEADFNNLETSITIFSDDFHTCMFACFLSQEEPKRVHQALKDPSWIKAMQEDLLQFKMQKVWILVDLPHGKRAIVARIEAIRLFLAYASFMGFMVYQMDVKSAFLYGTIEEEVYVCQPPGFEDPDHPNKVYKVVKALYEKPLLKDPDGEDVDVHIYRSMIGSLMYLTSSRPDIMFAVCACARFQVTPKASHLYAVKRIFIYLKGKPHLSLWYPKDSPFDLVAYSDSDYAGASLDKKSTTRGCQFLGCRLISWQCKKQTVVATSSIEAEYVAAASYYAQVLWIQNQLLDYVQLNAVQRHIPLDCIFLGFGLTMQSNDVTRLQALVDKKKVVISEAVIRDALRLADAEGVDCLPNEEIFTGLAHMGYEKPSTKLTFYKAFFSSQWKFLIHIILQSMSAKRTSWNEFSSAMASSVICLSTGRKFNFSKYIFDSLVRNVDSNSKFYIYTRFIQLIIQNQLGDLLTHTTKYISPALTQKVFANMRRVGKGCSGVETTLFEGMLVAGKPEEQGDSDEQVQGNDNDAAQVQSPLPQPQYLTPAQPQGADFPMSLLQEALDACAALTRRVEHLEHDKVAQDLDITKLKTRVKKLERANKVKALKLRRLRKVGTSQRIESSDDTIMEDVSNQGRMIDELDRDEGVALMGEKDEEKKAEEVKVIADDEQVKGRQADIYQIDIDHAAKVLSMQEDEPEVKEAVEVVTTPKLITKVVAAVSESVSAASANIAAVPAATITAAPVKSKDKGKGIMVEEPKPMKKKQHVELDEAYARKLHEELNQDIDWDVAIDHVKQKAKEDPLDYFKGMSYDDIRPIFEAKFNYNIKFLLKSKEQIEEEENKALESINETPAQKAAKKRKLNKEAKDVKEIKQHLDIVPDEDDDVYTEATPLARKVPIVDYQIIQLNNKLTTKS